jgi:hypothetical protein
MMGVSSVMEGALWMTTELSCCHRGLSRWVREALKYCSWLIWSIWHFSKRAFFSGLNGFCRCILIAQPQCFAIGLLIRICA